MHIPASRRRVLIMPRGPLGLLKKGFRYARSSGDETLLGHLWPTDYIEPLLFVLYINDICDVCTSFMKLYADDAKFY